MDAVTSRPRSTISAWIRSNIAFLVVVAFLAVLPFILAILYGQSFSSLLANERGSPLSIQGFMIEIFIIAVFAISYDLVIGITGLLSFGHAMFFAVGAYVAGIMLKSYGWSFFPAVGIVIFTSSPGRQKKKSRTSPSSSFIRWLQTAMPRMTPVDWCVIGSNVGASD